MIGFDNILGQETAIQSIRAAYRADRLPHGLIFTGPVGVGKGTTARALATLFLCLHPKKDEPCGKCDSCRAMQDAAANHPDYHIITKELIRYHDKTGKSKGIDLSINVIRPELIEPAARKPMLGHGKVFVIEQAELMNPAAQNAMLKTLEEPEGRTLIILLTDQATVLLPTIRSRCRTVYFASLDQKLVEGELKKRGISASAATEAARLSRGSIGLALKWIQDGVIEPAQELTSQIEKILSGHPADGLPEWFKKAADAYAEKQIERDPLASKDQATREGLTLYLATAAEAIRGRLANETDPGKLDRACQAIDAIARAEQYLDDNVNIPLIFQQLAAALERAA